MAENQIERKLNNVELTSQGGKHTHEKKHERDFVNRLNSRVVFVCPDIVVPQEAKSCQNWCLL